MAFMDKLQFLFPFYDFALLTTAHEINLANAIFKQMITYLFYHLNAVRILEVLYIIFFLYDPKYCLELMNRYTLYNYVNPIA